MPTSESASAPVLAAVDVMVCVVRDEEVAMSHQMSAKSTLRWPTQSQSHTNA